MNKVVLLLGIIVLVTLAMIFFCVGFFTGSNITPSQITEVLQGESKKGSSEKNITEQKVKEVIDEKSVAISDKILGILESAGSAGEKLSSFVSGDKSHKISGKKKIVADESHITIDSLLKEIVSSHSSYDGCSHEKTISEINKPQPVTDHGLYGKNVAFVGYFKNNIAAQIQKLLTAKGYHAHVERSKTGDGDESFIFCGPFKKDGNARKLVKWLQAHDFADARVISVTKDAVEETLFDVMNDDSEDMPKNAEYDILEANSRAARAANLNSISGQQNGSSNSSSQQSQSVNQSTMYNRGYQQRNPTGQAVVSQIGQAMPQMNQVTLPQMR